jgi:uncharacterized membrane protein YgdD (TMEM256/DUF423 family)
MSRLFVFLGSLNAFLAVALGAVGAHGLRHTLSADALTVYETAVQYHLIHAIGLVLIGIIGHWQPNSIYLRVAGGLLLAGILGFSGSLYVMSITEARWLGWITPFGGAAFLLGWLILALSALREL